MDAITVDQHDDARSAVMALCQEFDLRICGPRDCPAVGETRAVVTLDRIWRKRGHHHLRFVLMTIMETEGNDAMIDEAFLWAVSDLTALCSKFIERRPSDWLEVFDALPTPQLQAMIQRLNGAVPLREALVGVVFERLYRVFGDEVLQ